VIGNGAREHSICWALRKSKECKKIFCIPGNAGIEEIAICSPLNLNNKRNIFNNSEILLLEGWCCGSKPITNQYLFKNINSLENTFDKNNNWRKYYNFLLRNEYKSVFSLFDKQIYIQAPSFKYVLKWRYHQEKRSASKSNNKNFMNISDLQKFIQHYEKLTKWMIQTMPAKSDILIKLDSNQKIKKLLFKVEKYH